MKKYHPLNMVWDFNITTCTSEVRHCNAGKQKSAPAHARGTAPILFARWVLFLNLLDSGDHNASPARILFKRACHLYRFSHHG